MMNSAGRVPNPPRFPYPAAANTNLSRSVRKSSQIRLRCSCLVLRPSLTAQQRVRYRPEGPRPLPPRTLPFAATLRPLTRVRTGQPFSVMPFVGRVVGVGFESRGVDDAFGDRGSTTAMSASFPTAIPPLPGGPVDPRSVGARQGGDPLDGRDRGGGSPRGSASAAWSQRPENRRNAPQLPALVARLRGTWSVAMVFTDPSRTPSHIASTSRGCAGAD